MADLYTAQYAYQGVDRLDVTVKGNHAVGRIFAPTWAMVLAVKRGQITEQDYDAQYQRILSESLRHNLSVWEQLAQWKEITFVCFCKPGSHCHRYALAEAFQSLGYGIYKGER